jgi:two-component system, NtrC family, sensor histidine kinase HydH
VTDRENRTLPVSTNSALEMDDLAGSVLKRFWVQYGEQLDSVAHEFAAYLMSDERTNAILSAASIDALRVTSTVRSWLDHVLLRSDTASDPRHACFGLLEPAEVSDVPLDCLVRGISLVRRRLIGLVLGSRSDSDAVVEMVDVIERMMDLELASMLEAYRQFLHDRSMANERLATIGQLVASIGHELRNPLSTIETSAYLLAQRLADLAPSEPNLRKHIDKIRYQVRVATKTVADLLELAKNRPPRRSTVELLPLLTAAIASLRCPDEVRISLNVGEKLTTWADADQLRIILINLLTNALDAVKKQGSVTVDAAESEGGLALLVSDDGPGIASAAEERIFEALYTTKPNGNGLGLPLCRRIAIAHGGELTLQPSERGATFRLWLPGPTPVQ